MNLFVNDLSLHGQFGDVLTFRRSLEELMRCRECAGTFSDVLRVSSGIINRQVIGQMEFREAVQSIGDRTFLSKVISWIANNGPFIEDDLMRNPDEYFSIENGTVVTEEAIGEAATRHFTGLPVGIVSFAPSAHTYTPIEVHWHRNDADIKTCEIQNIWTEKELSRYLEAHQSPPNSWSEMVAQLPSRFPHLTFAPDLLDYFKGEPFSPYVTERSFVLLSVLNRLKVCFDNKGQRTLEGEELVENYFRREKARFSDSSEQEKNDARFRSAMTFTGPSGEPLECFWHGKIKSPQYRIHFSYPIGRDTTLYIAYIGPKLTKK